MRKNQSGYHTGDDSDERFVPTPVDARPSRVSLAASVVRGVRWISLATAMRVTTQLLQLVIVARLLAPADFGVMAVATTLLVYAQLFAGFGLDGAIVSGPEPSVEQRSSLYWFGLGASLCFALLLAGSGPWLADYYGYPELPPLLALAALHLLVWASWVQLSMFAERNLLFGRVAAIEAAGATVGLATSVSLALAGAGVFALMGGLLASGASCALLGWALLARGWRPRFFLDLGDLRERLRFGGFLTASHVAGMLTLHVDIVLGARLMGADAIGAYSMSKNLCQQIFTALNPIVSRVGLPVMARAQSDAARMRQIYLLTVRMVVSVSFPFFALLALFAPEAVRLLLGAQWDSAVPLLQVFALWALIRSAALPNGILAVASGRPGLLFGWNLVFLALHAGAALGGSAYGAAGIGIALVLVALLALIVHWHVIVLPLTGATTSAYLGELAVPLAITAPAVAAAWLAARLAGGEVPGLVAGILAAGAVYIALSRAFNAVWLDAVRSLLFMPGIGTRDGGIR